MKNTVLKILDDGHSVIIVYPIPEVGWHVPRRLMRLKPKDIRMLNHSLTNNPITTSYDVYLERTKASVELLDSIQHKNLYRVYPHKLFCDNQIKGRCITHDTDHLFYVDDDHLSFIGAEMVNDLIIDKINLINAERTN